MADFHFNIVPTFSLLNGVGVSRMGKKILCTTDQIPVGVLIPALFRDLSGDAMKNILEVLAGTEFVKRDCIAVDQAAKVSIRLVMFLFIAQTIFVFPGINNLQAFPFAYFVSFCRITDHPVQHLCSKC
jgi:hypothetical protein